MEVVEGSLVVPPPPGAYVFRVKLTSLSSLGLNLLTFRFLPTQHTAASTTLAKLCASNVSHAATHPATAERGASGGSSCKAGRMSRLYFNVSAHLSVELTHAPRNQVVPHTKTSASATHSLWRSEAHDP